MEHTTMSEIQVGDIIRWIHDYEVVAINPYEESSSGPGRSYDIVRTDTGAKWLKSFYLDLCPVDLVKRPEPEPLESSQIETARLALVELTT